MLLAHLSFTATVFLRLTATFLHAWCRSLRVADRLKEYSRYGRLERLDRLLDDSDYSFLARSR